jgi:hypothetical protein
MEPPERARKTLLDVEPVNVVMSALAPEPATVTALVSEETAKSLTTTNDGQMLCVTTVPMRTPISDPPPFPTMRLAIIEAWPQALADPTSTPMCTA